MDHLSMSTCDTLLHWTTVHSVHAPEWYTYTCAVVIYARVIRISEATYISRQAGMRMRASWVTYIEAA